jgi:TPR repeat protein
MSKRVVVPLMALSLATVVLVAAMPALQVVHAQSQTQPLALAAGAAARHVDGLAMERRGDQKGAFIAFLQAAEEGYPPAQRRLGEIYDSGNSAVERDHAESIRWYQKARAGGEQIPQPKPRLFLLP